MPENEVRIDNIPLARTKSGEGLVERRNVDPRDASRTTSLREGSQRLEETSRPRQAGLGGWSEHEAVALIGLGNYESIFEIADATGHATGWTACLEFRLGSLTYNPFFKGGVSTDPDTTEFILMRWGGKTTEAHVVASVIVTPGTGASSGTQTKATFVFRMVNGAAKSEVTWDLDPVPSSTDTVYKVAVGLGSKTSPTPSEDQKKITVRYLDANGAVQDAGSDEVHTSGHVAASSGFNLGATSHSDLTLLGTRPRGGVEEESTHRGGKSGKGARPVLTNFLLYAEYVLDADLDDILGQDI